MHKEQSSALVRQVCHHSLPPLLSIQAGLYATGALVQLLGLQTNCKNGLALADLLFGDSSSLFGVPIFLLLLAGNLGVAFLHRQRAKLKEGANDIVVLLLLIGYLATLLGITDALVRFHRVDGYLSFLCWVSLAALLVSVFQTSWSVQTTQTVQRAQSIVSRTASVILALLTGSVAFVCLVEPEPQGSVAEVIEYDRIAERSGAAHETRVRFLLTLDAACPASLGVLEQLEVLQVKKERVHLHFVAVSGEPVAWRLASLSLQCQQLRMSREFNSIMIDGGNDVERSMGKARKRLESVVDEVGPTPSQNPTRLRSLNKGFWALGLESVPHILECDEDGGSRRLTPRRLDHKLLKG